MFALRAIFNSQGTYDYGRENHKRREVGLELNSINRWISASTQVAILLFKKKTMLKKGCKKKRKTERKQRLYDKPRNFRRERYTCERCDAVFREKKKKRYPPLKVVIVWALGWELNALIWHSWVFKAFTIVIISTSIVWYYLPSVKTLLVTSSNPN